MRDFDTQLLLDIITVVKMSKCSKWSFVYSGNFSG